MSRFDEFTKALTLKLDKEITGKDSVPTETEIVLKHTVPILVLDTADELQGLSFDMAWFDEWEGFDSDDGENW